MHRNELYPSKYLKATPDVASDILVTIKSVAMAQLGQEQDEKPLMHFHELRKGLVLNQTNFNAAARICGSDETDDWVGQQIVLTTELVTFRGTTAPSIRIRAPLQRPPGARPVQTPAPRLDGGGGGGLLDDDTVPFGPDWK